MMELIIWLSIWWLVGYACCFYDWSRDFDVTVRDLLQFLFFAWVGPFIMVIRGIDKLLDKIPTKTIFRSRR